MKFELLVEKDGSPLVSCFLSGSVPGVYAYLAILITCPQLLLDDYASFEFSTHGPKSAKPKPSKNRDRFRDYFIEKLGDDLEEVLSQKLQDRVLELVESIIAQADGFARKSDYVGQRKKDYKWLRAQLRIFLLALNLLDGSRDGQVRMQRTDRELLGYPVYAAPDSNADQVWPIVCFLPHSVFSDSQLLESEWQVRPILCSERE